MNRILNKDVINNLPLLKSVIPASLKLLPAEASLLNNSYSAWPLILKDFFEAAWCYNAWGYILPHWSWSIVVLLIL